MIPISLVKITNSHVKTTELYEVCRLGHHLGSTFTGTDQNGSICRFGPELLHRTRQCRPCIAPIAGLAICQFFLFFFSAFHWLPSTFVQRTESYELRNSPSIGKPRMTPVSFVKITQSYEVYRWNIQGLQIRSPSG